MKSFFTWHLLWINFYGNCNFFFRSSNGFSNESLESLNLSSEDGAESDREMDIEEEDELDDDDEKFREKTGTGNDDGEEEP